MPTIKAKLRNDLIKKTGFGVPTAIYLQVCIDSKIKLFNTGLKTLPEFWDPKSGSIRRAFKGYADMNLQLKEKIFELEQIIKTLTVENGEVSLQDIELALMDRSEANIQKRNKQLGKDLDVPQALALMIDERTHDPRFAKSTVQQYEALQVSLTKYYARFKSPKTFEAIDLIFYDSFLNILYKSGLQPNSVGGRIKYLKAFMTWAYDREMHKNTAYTKFKPISALVDIIALTHDELDAIFNLEIKSRSKLEIARDLFVLGCTTGLRFSDLNNIKPSSIEEEFISVRTIKTKDIIKVPLNKYSQAIISKYHGNLPRISLLTMNKLIKEVGRLAGITKLEHKVSYQGGNRTEQEVERYKLISSHTARRTFVTLSLSKGIKAEVLMKITGHKSLITMQRYVKVTERDTQLAMVNAWDATR